MTDPCPAEEAIPSEVDLRAAMKAEMLDHLSRMASLVETGEMGWFSYVGALKGGPIIGSAGVCNLMIQVGLATLLKEEVTSQMLQRCEFRLVNEEVKS